MPSNHNIPAAALKILGALHYHDLIPLRDGALGKGTSPSTLFSTYACKDATISIATSGVGKPVTVTIAREDGEGGMEELLFHYDPFQQTLLTARQREE